MTDLFEDSERSRILDIVRNEFALPVIGEVKKVWPRDGTGSRPSNHEVDIGVPPGPNPQRQYNRVPVGTPTSGSISVPREDDLVLMQFQKGRHSEPFVTQVFYGDADKHRAPKGNKGDVKVNRGDLYTEMAGDGSVARIGKKSGDMATPDAEVTIDQNGKITINAETDVVVNATGDIKLAGGGNPIARKGDAVKTGDILTGSETGTIQEGSSNVESG